MMVLRGLVFTLILCLFCCSSFARQFSAGPGQTGEEIFDELLIGTNSIIVKAGSKGCTGKGSFRIDVKKEPGVSKIAPHYVLTINRTIKDECKAIMDEGVLISWDLEKDLGLKGNYTFSVTNMVYNISAKFRPHGDEEGSLISIIRKYFTISDARQEAVEKTGGKTLKEGCLKASLSAIGLEIKQYERRIEAAKKGPGDPSRVPYFEKRISELKKERERYLKMDPRSYTLPEMKTITVTFTGPYREGDLLRHDDMSRSGPFYHASGITGGDYSVITQGKKYELTIYMVYKRDYVLPNAVSSYVYIGAFREVK